MHLPHLWRYTLLRCSLSSRADQYPLALFKLLLLLKREPEVLGLAELLIWPEYKAEVLIEIATHLCKQATRKPEGIQIFLRAFHVASSIENSFYRARALSSLATALSHAGQWQQAQALAQSIEYSSARAQALSSLATALSQAGQWKQTQEVAESIEHSSLRAKALSTLAEALLTTKKYEQLLRFVQNAWLRAETREYALQLLPLALGFVALKPELGTAFYGAFKWVDDFLKG